MTVLGAALDTATLERLGATLGGIPSEALALHRLRCHLWLDRGELLAVTVDCAGPHPTIHPGHDRPAHVIVYVAAHAFVPLLAAGSLRDVFDLFQDGSIRLQQGAFFSMICLLPDRESVDTNVRLREALAAALAPRTGDAP